MEHERRWAGRDDAIVILFLGLLVSAVGLVIIASNWPGGGGGGTGSTGWIVLGGLVAAFGASALIVALVAFGVRIGLDEGD
jgi:hypothetical protein